MEISVFGAGYVGLVTAAGLASSGNHVYVIEQSKERVKALNEGIIPFFEPQLPELLQSVRQKNLIEFIELSDAKIKNVLQTSEAYFVAVGTPERPDGSSNLDAIFSVVDTLIQHGPSTADKYIVIKSTVPVGTGDQVEARLTQANRSWKVISNPEFLKQGNAVQDFLKPERVIIGTDHPKAADFFRFLYKPFTMKRDRVVLMSRRSAELVKYACNTYLATRISFINELSRLAEAAGADIREVREGMITDSRIGDKFLFPGLGYGGSCFPKDVHSLIFQGKKMGVELKLPMAGDLVNQEQKLWPVRKLEKTLGALKGKLITLWGLSFKPNTDDLRDAPSLLIIRELIAKGATVSAYDPIVSRMHPEALDEFKGAKIFKDPYSAVKNSDALVIVTEWQEFRTPNFNRLKTEMKNPLIIDGRNIYDSSFVRDYGFDYHCVGLGV